MAINERCSKRFNDPHRCTERMGLKTMCHYHYNYKLSSKGNTKTRTKSEQEEIVALYKTGLSLSQTAKRLGISKTTVLKYVTLHGCNRPDELGKGTKYSTNRRKPTPKEYVLNNSYNPKTLMTAEYKKFRISMFERDLWTCLQCGYRGSNIQLDHIKPRRIFPELTFSPDNVRTLCVDCHKKTETFGSSTAALARKLAA